MDAWIRSCGSPVRVARKSSRRAALKSTSVSSRAKTMRSNGRRTRGSAANGEQHRVVDGEDGAIRTHGRGRIRLPDAVVEADALRQPVRRKVPAIQEPVF